jgi:nicotinamidase/pyrazinamidase
VAGTDGAQLHPGLRSEAIDAIVDKGRAPQLEGYSGFEETDLEEVLRSHQVDRVHVAGLALDYCVRATALDARERGFDVVVHTGATRAIGAADAVVRELRRADVQVVD